MRTSIEDTIQGSTQIDCVNQKTVINMASGVGAELDIQALLNQVNLLRQDVVNQGLGLQQETTLREQAISALALEVQNSLTYIQQMKSTMDQQILDLTNLINSFAGIYPKVIMAGVVSSGVAVNRPLGSTIDFTDTGHYAILIDPEGSHEAWEVTRSTTSFSINVWHRSGTSRTGYSGNISYAVMQISSVPAP